MIFLPSREVQTVIFLTIFRLNDFLIGLDGVILDETVTSFSKWDPVQFSLQWPELAEMDRVLLWELVETMAFVEFDVVKLAEIVVSSR